MGWPPPGEAVRMSGNVSLAAGQRVAHPEFGEGILVESPRDGYARVFFPSGERQVTAESLRPAFSRVEKILANVSPGTAERMRKLWLAWEAHALPLLESAAALTAAKI